MLTPISSLLWKQSLSAIPRTLTYQKSRYSEQESRWEQYMKGGGEKAERLIKKPTEERVT